MNLNEIKERILECENELSNVYYDASDWKTDYIIKQSIGALRQVINNLNGLEEI